jgi:hypothetical protein
VKNGNQNLMIEMLKRMLEFDIILIENERSEAGMSHKDPKRKELSLRLTQFSVPYRVTKEMVEELKKFFKNIGWEFIKITSSPSIKIRKIEV